jgi:predicted peptidase
MKLLTLILGGLASIGVMMAQPASAEEQQAIPFVERWEARVFKNSQGETLPYRLLQPKHYDKTKTYPLVVFLHGMGERGSDNQVQLINGVSELFASDAVRNKYPAFVFAPQCPNNDDSQIGSWSNWEPGKPAITNPTRLALEIVSCLQHEFSIDENRMYLGGLSMGGFGTWNIIQEYPTLFAAAFPICGGGNPEKAARIAQMPLWVFHGVKDSVVPVAFSQNMVRAIEAAGGYPGYTQYPEVDHGSWTFAFQEPQLLPWLFAQKRPAAQDEQK